VKDYVLFVGTNNAVRSQMAEAILNKLYGKRYEAYSAGVSPTRLNPYAVQVMSEIGIDISKQRSKNFNRFC
jgi:arsenate reductase (thioredoxin)